MATLDWLVFLLSAIQTSAIVLGGLYTFYEYQRFRRYSPKIQFEVDFELHPIASESGNYLLNIGITVKNLGQVRNYFPKITVGVKALSTEGVAAALETHRRLRFGRELVEKHNIVPKPKDPWWVDSGVTQVFPYPVVIHEPGDFVQVNAEFFYYKGREKEAYHQASLVKPVSAFRDLAIPSEQG
jgi:hypothetical protein